MSITEKAIIKNFCCTGHEWEIAVILDETVWGCCRNLNCPQAEGADDYYAGVTSVERDELQLWIDIANKLAPGQQFRKGNRYLSVDTIKDGEVFYRTYEGIEWDGAYRLPFDEFMNRLIASEAEEVTK